MSAITLPRRGNTAKLVEAAGDIAAAPDPTEMIALGEETQRYYMQICEQLHIHTNKTFLNQLHLKSIVIVFKNDHLGENGIAAIVATLQRCAIHALSLVDCRLQVEDVKRICNAFIAHPTLEKLDLRGNSITVISSKRLLTLVLRNPRITEVILDEDTPNCDVIEQQCHQNMRNTTMSKYCAACGAPAAPGSRDHATDPCSSAPRIVFSVLQTHFTQFMKQHIAAEELFTFFALLLKVCDESNGAFVMCSEACVEKITLDLLSCASYARTTVLSAKALNGVALDVGCPFPDRVNRKWQNPTLTIIRKLRKELLAKGSTGKLGFNKESNGNFGENLHDVLDIMKHQPKCVDGVCPLCGITFSFTNVEHVASTLLKLFLHDVEFYLEKYVSTLGTSVFLRICRTMTQYATLSTCCSRKCLRQVSRFALYGFRGVIRSFYMKNEPLLSSMTFSSPVQRLELPECSFSILDMSSVTVYNVEEEDISCALTVSSAMEDIERVPIDPYFIYAAGRHLSRQPRESMGMTLQSACEAVCTFGCLEAAAGPFQRGSSASFSSAVVGDWDAWGRCEKDIGVIMRSAFARRRGGVYAVDGPYGNLFDNVRAALWTFKRQRRCVIVAIKASLSWLATPDGVIANENAAPRGGFYTTVKVVGQSALNNELHLILQGHFGPNAGYRGFFFITKSIFNRFTSGNAYIFLDRNSFANPKGSSMQSLPSIGYVQKVVSPCARELFAQLTRDSMQLSRVLHRLINYSFKGSAADLSSSELCHMATVLQCLPPILFFLRESERKTGAVFLDLQHSITEFVATFLSQASSSESASELIFLLSEVFGADVCRWLSFTLKTLSDRSTIFPQLEDAMEGVHPPLLSMLPEAESRRYSCEDWVAVSLLPLDASEQDELDTQSLTLTDRTLQYISPQCNVKEVAALHRQQDREPSVISTPSFSLETRVKEQEEAVSGKFCFELFGKRWSAVHLCNNDSTISSVIVCFLGSAACLYDLATSKVTHPLSSIKLYSTLLGEFPFTGGVDCAFNHPLRPCEVFLFSSGMFATWNAASRRCILGPCSFYECRQFAHLPEAFTRVEGGGMFAALPFPGTPLVALFSRSQEYVVYDLEKLEVQFLGSVPHIYENFPPAAEEEQQNYPKITDSHAFRRDTHNGTNQFPEASKHEHLRILPFGEEIMHHFITGGIPMAVLQGETDAAGRPEATSEAPAHRGVSTTTLLPMACGEVLSMKVSAGASDTNQWLSFLSVVPVRESKLAQLPLSFRQVTVEALLQICSAVVEHEVRANRHLISLELYEPSVMESIVISDCKPYRSPSVDKVSLLDQTKPPHAKSNVVVTAHQWGSTSNVEVSAFPNCFLSLSSSIASEEVGRNVTGKRDEVCYYYYPQQDAQTNLDTDASLKNSASWILFDLGHGHAEAFGAVIVVTNVFFDAISKFSNFPFVEGSDVKLFVESSEDGILFQRVAFSFTVRGHLAFASWEEVCAARYWRIRLNAALNSPTLSQLNNFGIVQVLWYRAEWQPTLCELGVLEPFIPSREDSPEVSIAAPYVIDKPEDILNCSATSAVFMAPARHGWWERRTVLPLLRSDDTGMSSAALFFCGGCLSEMDLDHYEVVGNRSVALRRHPAFNKLPRLFHTGIDAIFYTHLEKHSAQIVTLLRDGFRLHWNLQKGCAEGPVVRWQEADEFHGIPVDLGEDLVLITNTWRAPQEVRVIYRTQPSAKSLGTLCWDMDRCVVTAGPTPLDQIPPLTCPELGDKRISCIFSTPQAPNNFVIFAEDLVAHHSLPFTAPSCSSSLFSPASLWQVGPVSLSRGFHRLAACLAGWGGRRREAVVSVDLRGHPLLVLGVALTCQRVDSGRRWVVAYSDDAMVWHDVARHDQRGLTARTTWSPACVKGASHRFWRLSTVPCASGLADATSEASMPGEAQKGVFYSSLRFLVVPHTICRVLPTRLSTSGQLICQARELFTEDPLRRGGVVFGAHTGTGVNDATRSHYILFDYGSYVPALLAGLSIVRKLNHQERDESSISNPRRCRVVGVEVLCSNDAIVWKHRSSFSGPFSCLEAFWDTAEVLSPSRFWKLEFKVPSDLVIEQLMFYVAQCPLLKLHSSVQSLAVPCTSLLWASPCAQPSNVDASMATTESGEGFRLSTSVGNCLVLDMTSFSILESAICGVELHCTQTNTIKVVFCVECSQDEVKWLSVSNVEACVRQAVSTACWPVLGHYRFWRLRIISSPHPCGFMLLERVRWLTTKFVLYKTTPSDWGKLVGHADEMQGTILQVQLSRPEAMVGVKVNNLPPGSEYAVDRLDLDGITWREVGCITGCSLSEPTNTLLNWQPGPPSSSWRLRRKDSTRYPSSSSATILGNRARSRVSSAAHRGVAWQEAQMSAQWLGIAKEEPFGVDVSAIHGATLNCDKFEEIGPLAALCGSSVSSAASLSPGGVVLRSLPNAEDEPSRTKNEPTISWSFSSPLHFDSVCVYVRLTAPEMSAVSSFQSSAVAETTSPRYSTKQRGKKLAGFSAKLLKKRTGMKTKDAPKEIPDLSGSCARQVFLSLVVETSHNAKDYVPSAETVFSDGLVVLSWNHPGEAFQHWRLRLRNVPNGTTVDVSRVQWFALRVVSSAFVGQGQSLRLAMSNTAYATWRSEAFNHEDEFCEQCVSGFAQAKGRASRLLEENEIDRFGKVAKHVCSFRKKYERYIIRKRKEIVGGGIPRLESFPPTFKTLLSDTADLESDLNYILFCSSEHYNCNFVDLVELIGQPMNVGPTFSFSKKNSWFYPSLSITGKLQNSFFGLEGLTVSYTVYWSLSLELQRDMDQIENPRMNALSPHLASPVVSTYVSVSQYRRAIYFPGLPLLYHVGFGAPLAGGSHSDSSPVVISFALNELVFTEKYPLKVGGDVSGKTLSSPFSYRIFYGVNFIQYMTLASCPTFILELLRCIYPKPFLDRCSALMVFTAPSTNSRTAALRFTLSGKEARLLHAYGVTVDLIEFELNMRVNSSLSVTMPYTPDSTSSRPLSGRIRTPHRQGGCGYSPLNLPSALKKNERVQCEGNFITHGARYCFNPVPLAVLDPLTSGKDEREKGPSIPVSFVGSLLLSSPTLFTLQGGAFSGCIPCIPIPGAYIAHISILGTASAARDADQDHSAAAALAPPYAMDYVTLSGRLFLPNGKSYACSYDVPPGVSWGLWQKISLEFVQAPLEEVLAFAKHFFYATDGGASSQTEPQSDKYWSFISSLNIRVSMKVVADAVKRQLRGVGLAEWNGESSHDLVLVINHSRFRFSGTLPIVRLGPILLEGCPHTEKAVSFDLTCDESVGEVQLRAFGASHLGTTMSPIPTRIEVSSERGIFLLATTSVFDLSIEVVNNEGMFLSTTCGFIAQVIFHKELVFSEIEAQLRAKPLIVALCAHGMPFCLKFHNLVTEPLFLRGSSCTLERQQQWLRFSLYGVLFGGSFDVSSSWTLEDMSPTSLQVACKAVVMQIMEQCGESLWSSYANVVGCVQLDDPSKETSISDMGVCGAKRAPILERHLTFPQGCFMSRWIEKECELFEDDLE